MHLVTFERLDPDALRRPAAGGSIGDPTLGWDAFESTSPGARRVGALVREGARGGRVIDLNRALAVKLANEDVGAPEAEADSLVPADMLALLRAGARGLAAARDALAFALDALERFDAPDLERAGVALPRAGVRLCAPLPRPGKILAPTRGRAAHAPGRSGATPAEPVLFLKASSAVIGPEDDIVLPHACREVDCDGELAAVIGRRTREVDPAQALECVAGYCIASDVRAHDLGGARGAHGIGHSCDTFAPLGPALVTADEVSDPQDLGLRTLLSGRCVGVARTKELPFSVAELVSLASRLLTLEPGDVVLGGAPARTDPARAPVRWLRDGDVVEVAIEGLGKLRNHVRGARATPSDSG